MGLSGKKTWSGMTLTVKGKKKEGEKKNQCTTCTNNYCWEMLEGSDGVSGASGTFTQTQVMSWICPHKLLCYEHSVALTVFSVTHSATICGFTLIDYNTQTSPWSHTGIHLIVLSSSALKIITVTIQYKELFVLCLVIYCFVFILFHYSTMLSGIYFVFWLS